MADNSAFISYRRGDGYPWARLIWEELQNRSINAFLDLESMRQAGRFDTRILNQIAARPYFLMVLAEGALDRCTSESDWVRREIEHAISTNRIIVPLFIAPFEPGQFPSDLPDHIRETLANSNGVTFYSQFLAAALDQLADFLVPTTLDTGELTDDDAEFERQAVETVRSEPAPSLPPPTVEVPSTANDADAGRASPPPPPSEPAPDRAADTDRDTRQTTAPPPPSESVPDRALDTGRTAPPPPPSAATPTTADDTDGDTSHPSPPPPSSAARPTTTDDTSHPSPPPPSSAARPTTTDDTGHPSPPPRPSDATPSTTDDTGHTAPPPWEAAGRFEAHDEPLGEPSDGAVPDAADAAVAQPDTVGDEATVRSPTRAQEVATEPTEQRSVRRDDAPTPSEVTPDSRRSDTKRGRGRRRLVVALGVVIVIAAVGVGAWLFLAAGESSTLSAEEWLEAGDSIVDGDAELTMLDDGRLDLSYRGASLGWSFDGPIQPGAAAIFQDDGNFVVYPFRSDAKGIIRTDALWSTSTQGLGGTELRIVDTGTSAVLEINRADGSTVWRFEGR